LRAHYPRPALLHTPPAPRPPTLSPYTTLFRTSRGPPGTWRPYSARRRTTRSPPLPACPMCRVEAAADRAAGSCRPLFLVQCGVDLRRRRLAEALHLGDVLHGSLFESLDRPEMLDQGLFACLPQPRHLV